MNTLPDYLPGCPPMYGVKQESNQYMQGSSIVIEATLHDNGTPVDTNLYSLKVAIKVDKNSTTSLWRGYLNYGIFMEDGKAVVKLPNNVVAQLPSGIYYLAIEGTLKNDPTHICELYSQTFSINPSAASHFPIATGDVYVTGS